MRKAMWVAAALSAVMVAGTVLESAASEITGSITRPRKDFRKDVRRDHRRANDTFTDEEIMAKGHEFFGKTTRDLSKAVTYIFQRQGKPTAYIVGEEGAGAFVGGLRYGEGTIYYKDGRKERIFWQGPSVGFDFGGNGSRTMVLVYDSRSPADIHHRFIGVEGSAYFIGGLGVNFQQNNHIILAPIRTGLGARLGANVGYLKYSPRPTWNPF